MSLILPPGEGPPSSTWQASLNQGEDTDSEINMDDRMGLKGADGAYLLLQGDDRNFAMLTQSSK